MEIPPRYPPRDHGGGLPSIYIDRGDPSRAFGSSARTHGFPSSFSPTLLPSAMTIPGSRSHDKPPPPLPPPRYPVDDVPSHLSFRDNHRRELTTSSGGHSNYGSLDGSLPDERPRYKSRDSFRMDLDEGYASLSLTRSPDSAPTRFGMTHESFQLTAGHNNGLDKTMLSKLDARRTLDNRSPPRRSAFSRSTGEMSARSERFPLALQPLSLCTRPKQLIDSPSRFTETPIRSALSPRSTPFDYRSPSETGDLERSPIPRSRRTNSGNIPDDITVSTQSSTCELNGDDGDFAMEETSRLHGFHIDSERHDYQSAGVGLGQKRRASSPPSDDPPLSLASDMLRRRDTGASRGSPQPRLTVIPQGSISSASSAGRAGYASSLSLSMTADSMTGAASSASRRSPGSASGGGLSPTETTSVDSPYATPISLTTSPRMAVGRAVAVQQPQRQVGDQPLTGQSSLVSPIRKLNEAPKSNIAKMSGFFMCDCCPKKPKKFETQEELSVHEAEKQYECQYCGNRFKNKNEAERHQNSLHVRRHSWSCSALTGYERAFHESTTRPGDADTCGYCGEEFARNGPPGGSGPGRYVSDDDWVERIRHLTDVHKFRECNSSKKFFRADHFRQHLKHSHAGTSGKWTNMLENACMLEEDPPLPPGGR